MEVQHAPSPVVLVVDDDEIVRKTTAKMLCVLGYEVLTAPSGEAALEILNEKARQVKWVVTDYNMPTMNGLELAKQIEKRWSGISLLMVSGRVTMDELDCFPSRFRFMRKPYGIDQLEIALSEEPPLRPPRPA